RALSVKLGPGLLGGIFDGLLRPLTGTDDFQIQAGLGSGAAGRFRFVPQANAGATLETGAILGAVAAAREQLILVPPGVAGRLEWLAAEGEYGEDEVIARLVGENGKTHE